MRNTSRYVLQVGLIVVALATQFGVTAERGVATGLAPPAIQIVPPNTETQSGQMQEGAGNAESSSVLVYLPLVSGGTGKAAVLQYQVGKSYLYDYNSVINSRSNADGSEGAQSRNNVLTTTMTAKLTPIQQESGGAWLLELRVENPKFVYVDENGVIQDRSDPDMERDLVRPAYFYQFTNGKVGNIKYDPRDAFESINLKRGLISALQTQLGRRGDFTAAERDVSGQYSADYSVAALGDTQVISRARNQDDYAPAVLGGEDDADVIIRDQSIVRFDTAQGLITTMSATTLVAATDDSSAIASLSDTGVITGTDGVPRGDGITDQYGSRITAQSLAQSSLELERIQAADPASLPDPSFIEDDLIAEPPPVVTPTVSLEQAMLALSADPRDLATLDTVIAATRYQPTEALAAWRDLLRNQRGNAEVMQTVMGALASVGSVEAQDALIDEILLSESASDDLRVAALGNLSAVRKPSARLLAFVQQAMLSEDAAMQPQIALVWGALANKLARTEPDQARAIVTSLENELTRATAEGNTEAVEFLLGALGNAGDPAALPAIARKLSDESSFVRLAAVEALRKMPARANDLLAQAALDSNGIVREAALALLNSRMPNSSNARIVNWGWWRRFGDGDFYAIVDASLYAEDTPYLYAKAYGDAYAVIFGKQRNLLRGLGITDVIDNGTRRRFEAYVWLMDNLIVYRDVAITCGGSSTGRLAGYSLSFFSFDKTFFVGPVPVNLRVDASGNFAVDYAYAWSACNLPLHTEATVSVTPQVWVRVTGYAGVSLLIVRGGIGAEVNLLKLSLPVSTNAALRSTAPYFTACLNVATQLQPASGSLFLWYQTWAVRWPPWNSGWNSPAHLTLWSFGTATYNWTLINQCYYLN